MLLAAFATVLMLLGPVPPVQAAGPVPEHHVFAVLRDYFPSSAVSIKQGERIRFVDTDPEGVTPRFDSDIVPPYTFKDVANVETLPPGQYSFNCKIHNVLKGQLTVG